MPVNETQTTDSQPEGGLSSLDSGAPAQVSLKSAGKGQLGTLSVPTGSFISEESSKNILNNMQKMLDEYNTPNLQDALMKAHAWTLYNKEPAFRLIQEQEQQKQANKYNLAQSAALLQGQMAQNKIAQNEYMNLIGGGTGAGGIGGSGSGAGGMGVADLPLSTRQLADVYAKRGLWDKALAVLTQGSNIQTKSILDARNRNEYTNPNITIRIPDNTVEGGFRLDTVSQAQIDNNPKLRELVYSYNLPSSTQSTVAPQAYGQRATLDQLHNAFYGQESSYGKEDTTKPNKFGVVGPMQIKKSTFEDYQKQNVIPKDFDINNPEQNKKAGELILDSLYKKYNGDISKVAAEYYGGAGAIDANGNIIRNIPGGRPGDPTVGEYVDQINKRIGMAPSTAAQTTTLATTLPELKKEQELEQERQKQLINLDIDKRKTFEGNTDKALLEQGRTQSRRAMKLLEKDPNIAGVLADPSVKNALLEFAGKKIGQDTLENVIFKATANSPLSMADRQELAGYLAGNEIRNRGLIKGTGSISDYEQRVLSKISGSISDPAEVLYKRFRLADKTNEFNLATRRLYDAQNFKSMRDFENSKEYQTLLQGYVKDLENIYQEKKDFTKARQGVTATTPQTGRPKDIDDIIKKLNKTQ